MSKVYIIEENIIGHDGCEAVTDTQYVIATNARAALIAAGYDDYLELQPGEAGYEGPDEDDDNDKSKQDDDDTATIDDFYIAERPGYVTARLMSRSAIDITIAELEETLQLLRSV